MSEIENGRLGLYDNEHWKSNHLVTLGFKWLTVTSVLVGYACFKVIVSLSCRLESFAVLATVFYTGIIVERSWYSAVTFSVLEIARFMYRYYLSIHYSNVELIRHRLLYGRNS